MTIREAPVPGRHPIVPLLLISVAIFASVTAELLPAGLLVPIAVELTTTEAAAGLLVSGFALAVAVSTVPLTAATRRLPRKPLLVALLVTLAVTTAASGLAPDYASMLGIRIVGGAANGLFWAVAAPYASRLVPPERLTRAMVITTLGGTAAFIGGVPLGTALGDFAGWRVPFLVLAALVALVAVGVAVRLPAVVVAVGTARPAVAVRGDLRRLALLEVAVLLFVVGHHTSYTYVSVWLASGDTAVTAQLLLAFGIAGGAGALVVGLVGDRAPTLAVVAGAALAVAALVLLATWGGTLGFALAGAAAWGLGFGPLPVIMQSLVFRAVADSMRDLAAAIHTVVFNFAIAVGAAVGGALVGGVAGVAVPLVSVAVFVVAIAAVLIPRGQPDSENAIIRP